MHSKQWQFWIDRGGTFTDVVGRDPTGQLHRHKLLSEDPARYDDAALAGIRRCLGVANHGAIPSDRIADVRMGTTVATNALLERAGEPVGLLITQGHADTLRIGYQTRPKLFELNIQRPAMLAQTVIEVDERRGAHGEVVRPLDLDQLRARLKALRAQGIHALAVALIHADRYPDHELKIGELAKALGFSQVSLSHQVSPVAGLIGRADTTVVDAYLSPLIRRHVEKLAQALGPVPLWFMKSDGGLTPADAFTGKDAILSGPAGGVVGAVATAQAIDINALIGFDMGGTSTDVFHYRGELERRFETEVDGVRLRAPMLDIHTVAAGGGSTLRIEGGRYQVGPSSAGADPGPCCYGRGGPLTVTDCQVMLGRIQKRWFPAVLGHDGDQPLDVTAVQAAFKHLHAATHRSSTPATLDDLAAMAEGFMAVAVHNMANAIKQISVRRGRDIRDYALQCFGGAGAQHACEVADTLGMSTIILHPLGGLLSAYGMGLAEVTQRHELSLECPLDEAALSKVAMHPAAQCPASARMTLRIRYAGTSTALPIAWAPTETLDDVISRFSCVHERQFGFVFSDRKLELATAMIETIKAPAHRPEAMAPEGDWVGAPCDQVDVWLDGCWQRVPVWSRPNLVAGQVLEGPALIIDPHATIVVSPGWKATQSPCGSLQLTRDVATTPLLPQRFCAPHSRAEPDPVHLEIFNNLFMAIAEQMGEVLRQTAWSANIKERLDYSCALFDARGALVANAPHVPVHLGSMGESVRAVIDAFADDVEPGQAFVLNNPYQGGTHLPDLTVVSPFFDGDHAPLFWVASRAHHADIGGLTPGSMPPDSQHIDQEGVLIDPLRIMASNQLDQAAVVGVLTAGPAPARQVTQNLADLSAQLAANQRGLNEIARALEQFGRERVLAATDEVQANAAEHVRQVIDHLKDGCGQKTLDNGACIQVTVKVDHHRRRACIDFSGSSAQLADNFNAPAAITRACVLYVLRCLVQADIPLNEGCLAPIDLVIPDGSLLNPRPPAAVVAGNVETSQALTDALLAAMGAQANSQGTMNNLTFGNDEHQHYETICGGSGAGPGFDGCDAVQVHMTNSRLTDPEVLEMRFPVRLETFGVRSGSGGQGKWQGGSGVLRRLRFLEPMTVAVLATSRVVAPAGMCGGGDGMTGRAWIERADGGHKLLSGCDQVGVNAGDAVVIETPGGGGWGHADKA